MYDSQQQNSNFTLDKFKLSDVSPTLYQDGVSRILPACAPEYGGSTDFAAVVNVLNQDLSLRLEPLEEQTLTLLLTGLTHATRFGDDIFMESDHGENSAVHSCHTAILANEMFRRAGLLDEENQTSEVTKLRIEMSIGSLVHDMGEMLGELTSLAQRSLDTSLQEDADVERNIFSKVLTLAIHSSDIGHPGYFYSSLRTMRDAMKNEGLSHQEALERVETPELGGYQQGVYKRFMSVYDTMELKNKSQLSSHQVFLGEAGKAIEHMQGTRHFTRFCTKFDQYNRLKLMFPKEGDTPDSFVADENAARESIPLSFSESVRISKNLKYTEGEVGKLFDLAVTDVEIELARAIRDSVYGTVIEWMNASGKLFDSSLSEPDQKLAGLMQEYFKLEPSRSDKIELEELEHLAAVNGLPDMSETFSHMDQKAVKETLMGALRPLYREMIRERADELQGELKVLLREYYRELREQGVSPRESINDVLPPVMTRGLVMDIYLNAIAADYHPESGEILALRDALPDELVPLKRHRWDRVSGKKTSAGQWEELNR